MKAYLLTVGTNHYKSDDQGKTWKRFETELAPSFQRNPLSHHATKPEYVLFTGMECTQDPVWRDRFDCFENVCFLGIGLCKECASANAAIDLLY